MSSYKHRVEYTETPTTLVPPRRISASLPVVFGTAPVQTLEEGVARPVNTPVLCSSYTEFVEAFGWSDDWDKYTLCEFAYAFFALFNVGPVVFVNVFDPATHTSGDPAAPDPAQVTSADIIGGIDADSGDRLGLELVSEVFPRFRLVPGLIVAPGWSEDPAVAVIMAAKADGINGLFKAMAVVDIPDASVTKYTDVPAYKEAQNLTDELMIVGWGRPYLGDYNFHMSTQIAGLLAFVDADHDDVPYVSPSNQRLLCNGVRVNGKDVFLGLDQVEYLNGQGVLTALNFDGGWKLFGNRTGCYPSVTDVKDAFIPIRRFFNWHGNTFVLTYFQKLDYPITRRLVETIVDSENIRLNGFVKREILLGGRMAFREEDNTTLDLMDGMLRFHTWMTPPSPARQITNVLEYDPEYISSLFGG